MFSTLAVVVVRWVYVHVQMHQDEHNKYVPFLIYQLYLNKANLKIGFRVNKEAFPLAYPQMSFTEWKKRALEQESVASNSNLSSTT